MPIHVVARDYENVAGDRVFIFTRVPPPVGTLVRFEIQSATGDCLFRGEGTVVRAVPEAPKTRGAMELHVVGGVNRGASNGADVSRRSFDATK